MQNRVARVGLWSAALLAVGGWLASAMAAGAGPDDGASTILRDGFETPKVAWRQEQTDATVKIFAHERTNRAAHEGQLSEGFQFEAGIGGGLYFSYQLPNIPVTERPEGRPLRPIESVGGADPRPGGPARRRRPRQPRPRRIVLVPGTVFETPDRWQKLELADMLPSIERQAKVLRASSKRPVSLKGAYLERLVVNIYGGEGETEVYLDELTVGPVPATLAANPRTDSTGRRAVGPDDRRPARGVRTSPWSRSRPGSTPGSSSTGTA